MESMYSLVWKRLSTRFAMSMRVGIFMHMSWISFIVKCGMIEVNILPGDMIRTSVLERGSKAGEFLGHGSSQSLDIL